MFYCHIFLGVSLLTFLHGFHVYGSDECADMPVFTPSRLVVKFGDPTSAQCTVCQHACLNESKRFETSVGDYHNNGNTTIFWTMDKMTEWTASPQCYYTDSDDNQCNTKLPITVYQLPNNVSFAFNHTGPMLEGRRYALQCTVEDVAPIKNLNVTFYKGETVLGQQQQSPINQRTPVTEIFTIDIIASKEDDGAQYWCEARLDLGPEGPQPPPVVKSDKYTATVFYAPVLEVPPRPDLIAIIEGDPLLLDCSAVGNPAPSYTWTLPSNNAHPSNKSVYKVDSVAVEHTGQYNCSVSNYLGNADVLFDVTVQVDHNMYIIIGAVIAAVVLIAVGALTYTWCNYKHKSDQYNLKDVFRLSKRRGAY